VPVPMLDDLGAQSRTDWAWEKLYQILVHRRHWKLSLVVTTNLDVCRAFPDRRIASRFNEKE